MNMIEDRTELDFLNRALPEVTPVTGWPSESAGSSSYDG